MTVRVDPEGSGLPVHRNAAQIGPRPLNGVARWRGAVSGAVAESGLGFLLGLARTL